MKTLVFLFAVVSVVVAGVGYYDTPTGITLYNIVVGGLWSLVNLIAQYPWQFLAGCFVLFIVRFPTKDNGARYKVRRYERR